VDELAALIGECVQELQDALGWRAPSRIPGAATA
jgi:hypothetical protein